MQKTSLYYAPKRILFASIPDGHFNPMIGMAMELNERRHDVRWFEGKLTKLGITHYPFKKALEANQFNADELFPERKKYKLTKAKTSTAEGCEKSQSASWLSGELNRTMQTAQDEGILKPDGCAPEK